MQKIDFKQVASQALSSLESLVNQWLPGGKRDGHEYKAINPTRADSKAGSFSINLNTGAWADFATDDKGGDAISLYAYLFGCSQLDAARAIMDNLGIRPSQGHAHIEKKLRSDWMPVVPVPEHSPPPPVAHIKRGKPDQSWKYSTAEGGLVGFILRFTTSDGGKEILPLTYCRHAATGAEEWRWMAFPDPRPLYVPGEWRDGVTKLVVEGEKCAVVAFELLDEYDAVTWPGGSKAVDKADWSRFKAGDKVLLWPDCDAQTDKSGGLLPAEKQPGIAAMEKVAQKLLAIGCKVRVVDIPAPGEKPGGWDIADAVAEGLDKDGLMSFIKGHQRAPAAVEVKSISTAGKAGAGDWTDELFYQYTKSGPVLRDCRENVFKVLENSPEWAGVLARDIFSNKIIVIKPSPVGHKQGDEWMEEDDFKLGLWLATNLRLFIRASGNLSDGIRAAADRHRFHPVRDWLDGLKWNGTSYLDDWLEDFCGVAKTEYTSLVGRYFLIGMVARIYEPGCKMDNMPIFEGAQGKGKSSLLSALCGEWFADTPFVMGDKDAFQALRGKWLYEISELDAFNRAEATRAKAFISSGVDSYRAPYDRNVKDWPRQCVFAGTTNQHEYFKDSSGNRRYWPLSCDGEVNIEALRSVREQLFAEAVQRYRAGDRWYPTAQEQRELFDPQQEHREIGDPWLISLQKYVSSFSKMEVTSLELLTDALNIEVGKIDNARQMVTRIGICMRKLGWGKKRLSGGAREWVYTRPKQLTEGNSNDLPL